MTPDLPIVTDIDKVDYYKPKMQQFILEHHPRARVRFAFHNRHANRVPLQKTVDVGELREHVAHARTLRYTNAGTEFLRESEFIPKGTFREPYLQFRETFQLPELNIDIAPDRFVIEAESEWLYSSPWETLVMNIVNQLHYRRILKDSGLSLEDAWVEGRRRLMEKIELLKQHPWIKFSSFGLRRAFANMLLDRIDEILANELPNQLVGISDVQNARRFGKRPVGTIAHEMFMVVAALLGLDDEGLRKASPQVLEKWLGMYGPDGTTAIPDTFGSESFLEDIFANYPHIARQLITYKIDSGDPFERGDLHIRSFQNAGIDPLTRKLLFCDGLDVPAMIKLHDYFNGRVGLAPFGPGTNFSNDFGSPFIPVSMVMKAAYVWCNGIWVPCVKLSDNLEKAFGPQDEVERYVRVHGYRNRYRQACIV